MRRGVLLLALFAAFALPASAHAASWAQPQIEIVVDAGLMGPDASHFRASEPLTRAELGYALAVLTQEEQVVVDPERAVTIAELHRKLVQYLGLGGAARLMRVEAADAGLTPPKRFGTEVVARLLRLRTNHPADRDFRELRPRDPATRAEAAFSLARVLDTDEWDVAYVKSLADDFALPSYTEWQRRVLERAVRFVGYPYVWGGTSEHPQVLFGVASNGGFDCSGFVWRVYKLQPFSGGESLQYVFQGRTTYEMSGEVPRWKRIPRDRLKAADVPFFGSEGTSSRPAQVDHMGIYLGRGWMIHSSSQGVTLVPLSGWYADRFAWARRPLREAGLT
jgi:cell wall-associated NlpC family hydrolase